MLYSIKALRTFKSALRKLRLRASIFLLVGICLAQSLHGQKPTDPCAPNEYPFTGTAAPNLCGQYGSLEYNVQVGSQSATGINNSSQLGTSYSGYIWIKGTFYIDNNFSFVNSIIKIDPGSTILVLPPSSSTISKSFTIDNSKLFACAQMWNGIVLSNNTTIFTKNGTEIEDADVAIKADNIQFSTLMIENTTFNRDGIGILLMQSPTLPKAATIARFRGNKFTCTAPLNGTADQVTYAGVKTVNVPFTVNPLIEAHNNRFVALQYGIRAEGAQSTVSGQFFRFERMKRDGIYMENGVLSLFLSWFTNCEERGANIQMAQEVRLSGCTFEYDETITDPGALFNSRDGFYVKAFGTGSRCIVAGCRFNAELTSEFKNVRGLHIAGNNVGAGTYVVVTGCSWDFVAFASEGIYIPGIFVADSEIDIFNNTFNIDVPSPGWTSIGIRSPFGDKHNLEIIGNDFTSAGNPGWSYGLMLWGSEGMGNQFSDNDFPGPSLYFDSFNPGVDVNNFKNTKFCSSEFYNTRTAFQFYGQNDNTDFISNRFYGVNMLTIGGSSWIDDQNQMGNTWQTSPWSPYVVSIQAEMTNANFAQLSNFFVHTPQSTSYSGPGFYPYHPKEIVPDVDDEWWKMEPGSPASACIDELTGGGASQLKMGIADGTIGGILGDASLEWQAKRGLYRTLMEDTAMIGQYPAFSSFLTSNASTAIGKLYDVSKAIEAALEASPSMLLSVKAKQHELDSLQAALSSIDSTLEMSTSTAGIAAMASVKSDLSDQLLQLVSSLHSLDQDYRADIASAIGAIRLLNDNIAASTAWESDEKTVNAIYLDYLELGTLTEGQIGALTTIAEKCPKSGGMAVYKARSLLPDCISSSISDNYENCYPAQPAIEVVGIEERSAEPVGKSSMPSTQSTILYPNPASDKVWAMSPDGTSAMATIANSLGKTMVQGWVSPSQPLELTNLAPGIYMVRLHLADGTVHSHKLIVTR
ncbi:MAG: T9SS type A sorting domain-containing protein [Bacteroidetes bacterium]|nr:T9SS type A sorting domain-containing protein [Bacteroidota bacterium]